jgi:hypothetical protein
MDTGVKNTPITRIHPMLGRKSENIKLKARKSLERYRVQPNQAVNFKKQAMPKSKKIAVDLESNASKTYAELIRNRSTMRASHNSINLIKTRNNLLPKESKRKDNNTSRAGYMKNSPSKTKLNTTRKSGRHVKNKASEVGVEKTPEKVNALKKNLPRNSLKSARNKDYKSPKSKPVEVDLFRKTPEVVDRQESNSELKQYLVDPPESPVVHGELVVERIPSVNNLEECVEQAQIKNAVSLDERLQNVSLENRHPNTTRPKPTIIDLSQPEAEDDDVVIQTKPAMPKPVMTKTESKTSKGATRVSIDNFKEAFSPLTKSKTTIHNTRSPSAQNLRESLKFKLQSQISKEMKKLKDLFQATDFKLIKTKLKECEMVQARLHENDKCVKQANLIAFFFLNFYKDFEQKIIKSK